MNLNYSVKDNQNEIKYVICTHGIEQLIKKTARFDSTHKISILIYIIRTNLNSSICSSYVIPLSIGDYNTVGCLRKINCKKFVSR